ncbi:YIP1 family protein [bacterium]|nr:YIP1 family protein [bacterium]
MENGSDSSKSMGVFGRIGNIFMSPEETFESVEQRPLWWVPLILVIIVAIGAQIWLMDIYVDYQKQKVEANKFMTQEQIKAAKARIEGPGRYFGIAITPVLIMAAWLLTAALMMAGSNSLMDGKAKFSQILGVVAWSSLVTMIGGILKSVLVFLENTPHGIYTSLAAFMKVHPIGEKPSILYHIASKMDPFMVWQVVLWAMGLAVVAKIKKTDGLTVAFSVWFIWIVISSVIVHFFGDFI